MKNHFFEIIKAYIWQIITIFLALILMIAISFYFGDKSVSEQVKLLSEETMNTIETEVTSSLNMAEYQFETIFEDLHKLILAGADNDEILSFMYSIRREYKDTGRMPEFMSTYGYINKALLFDDDWVPEEDYSPYERPWYDGAIHNHNLIFFSEPYIDARTGKMVISFSRRLVDASDNFIGVFAMDLEISRITDFIANQSIGGKGYGVFISDSLKIVSHRDKSLIGRPVKDAGSGYVALSKLMEEGKNISVERFTDTDGTDSIAFFRPIFDGWHIGMIVPSNVYYNQIYHMILLLVITGIVLIGILCYIFIKVTHDKLKFEEDSRQKSKFIARISHEMRTPMNAILGMSEIAGKTDDSKKIAYCLERINDASIHLLDVITDVLDLCKIEAGDIEIKPSDFVVKEMLNRVISVFSYNMSEKHQELTVHIGKQVPNAIISDARFLTQVMMNLLSNANKYTPSGGRINVSVEAIEHFGNEHLLRFSVSDNGIGLTEEQKSEIFSYSSSGLGLANCQLIIKKMGGEIWAESIPGENTRFIFDLRVEEGKATDDITLKNPNILASGLDLAMIKFAGKHILIVEDIEINREIVINLLSDTEVLMDCAENGREAVAMISAEPDKYDLIFMDIQMPDMDGYEATAKIREMESVQARNIPIIAMTGNVFKEDAEHCIKAGMNGHIGKPVQKEELLLVMHEFIIECNNSDEMEIEE